MYYFKSLYIFFLVLALNIFFFSTASLKANPFFINDIEISEQLENNFNKELLINKGFKKAFNELISKLVKSKDLNKTKNIKLNEIKVMIDSFSIKEEKFINKIYHLNLGVSFNKRKVFNYLERKNIFPAQIITETFLFIPIIFNQEEDDLLVFSNNPIYKNWNEENYKGFLVNYVLPTEDLEDLNLIKEKSSNIENYDFKKITKKYFLKHSVVALIFKDKEEIKVLSKIIIKDKKIIKNNTFKNFNFNDKEKIANLINELKIIYEDIWKDQNQINTSIKLPLLIQVDNKNLNISLKFEKTLDEVDLINSYLINKFDKDNIIYEVIFNGTPKNFINIMSNKDYKFDTKKKVWVLK
jgi:hypothetical protein